MNEKTVLCTSCGAPLDPSSGKCLYCSPRITPYEKPRKMRQSVAVSRAETPDHDDYRETTIRTKPGMIERLLTADPQARFLRLITASRIAGLVISCGVILYLSFTHKTKIDTRIIEYLPVPRGKYSTAISVGNMAFQSTAFTLALIFGMRPFLTGWRFIPYLFRHLGRTLLGSCIILGISWFAGVVIYYCLSMGIGITFFFLPVFFRSLKLDDMMTVAANLTFALYFITVISMAAMASQYCDDRRTWSTC